MTPTASPLIQAAKTTGNNGHITLAAYVSMLFPHLYHFQYDLFAKATSNRLPLHYSSFPESMARKQDTFSHSWNHPSSVHVSLIHIDKRGTTQC